MKMKKTCIAILAGATLLTPAFLPQAAPAAQARSLWSDDGTTYTQNIFADRKARYTAEAAQHFQGGIYVPDDLDVVEL